MSAPVIAAAHALRSAATSTSTLTYATVAAAIDSAKHTIAAAGKEAGKGKSKKKQSPPISAAASTSAMAASVKAQRDSSPPAPPIVLALTNVDTPYKVYVGNLPVDINEQGLVEVCLRVCCPRDCL